MHKHFFQSKITAYAAIICIIVLALCENAVGVIIGTMTSFEYFDIAVRLFLSVLLFDGYRKHNTLTMQGGCSGLLVCMTYSQANFVLNDLYKLGADGFVILGFWGAFYLAGELMLLILEIILTVNHFVLFILKKKNELRVSVNQVTIVIMLVFLLFQTFVVTRITMEWSDLAFYGLFNLGLILVFILIGCAEFSLAVNDEESKG